MIPCDLNPGRKATVHIAYPLPKRVRTPTKVLLKCEVGNVRVTEYLLIVKNVSLCQNTTIGAKGFNGAEKSPVIEDDVTIGPNVCIIGNITIGKGAVIGAGAVVVKDVEPFDIMAGNPAKSIRK